MLIADARKDSPQLGTVWTRGVPLEIAPTGWTVARAALLSMGAISASLRMGGDRKAGPVVTDGGHFVIDAHFGPIADPATLEARLKQVPGVLETGLFVGFASKAFLGNEDGSVEERTNDAAATPFARSA